MTQQRPGYSNDSGASDILIGLNAVILAVTREEPRVLTVGPQTASLGISEHNGYTPSQRALPFGPFDAERDRTLELCMRDRVRDQTGIEFGFVEQLYTFADKGRDPRELAGGSRVMSVAYLALVRESMFAASDDAAWGDCYQYFPWEDWRNGRPPLLDQIESALNEWLHGLGAPTGGMPSRSELKERIDICFGFGEAAWDAYRVLQRYELLYEARLVAESWLDRGEKPVPKISTLLGDPMAFDHRRILATGLGRVRGKLQYRPLAFELIPDEFTLLQLQNTVDAISGLRSHKQNFRRMVERSGLVEGTGVMQASTGGRPAELFRFRRAVLTERRAPGMTKLRPPR